MGSVTQIRMQRTDKMSIERWLRLIAGVFVAASVALGVWVNPWWFAFTGFVGVNLLQSAFTDWCPMVWILERFGAKRERVLSSSRNAVSH